MKAEYMLSEIGRIVQGSALEVQTHDYTTDPPTLLEEPEYYLALAVPKGPGFDRMWALLQARAQVEFPNGEHLPLNPATGQPWPSPFSWKVVDGDSPKYADKEGFPGHYVFRLSTKFAPKGVDAQDPPQTVGPEALYRGCYVRVRVGYKSNLPNNRGRAGLFLNYDLVQFAAHGEPLRTGPSAAEVFAVPMGPLPAGASIAPVAAATIPATPATAAIGTAPPGAATPHPAAVATPPAAGPAVAAETPPMGPAVTVGAVAASPVPAPAATPAMPAPAPAAAPAPTPVPAAAAPAVAAAPAPTPVPAAAAPIQVANTAGGVTWVNPATNIPVPVDAAGNPVVGAVAAAGSFLPTA